MGGLLRRSGGGAGEEEGDSRGGRPEESRHAKCAFAG
jgi:hypothetical protein